MQEEYMTFFLRHIVLNAVVWLKLNHYVFRRLRRMFRHNGLKDSLSQVLHFILQFILITRKATSAKAAWRCPSLWNTCPSHWLHNVQRAGLSDSLTIPPGPRVSRMLWKIYLDKIFQILTFSDPVTEQDRKLLLFKMPDSYFQQLTDFLIADRIYKHSSFFSSFRLWVLVQKSLKNSHERQLHPS